MGNKTVFVCGGASFNTIITLSEFPKPEAKTIHNCDFHETLGNTAAGKALNLARLNFDTILHTLVGNDTYGEMIIKNLDHPKISLLTDLDDTGTERHLNLMNTNGERISIFMKPSSDDPKIDYSKFIPYIKNADYVVINISNYCRHLIPLCKSLNKMIWTDLHDYDGSSTYHEDFIESADYIFLSSDNMPNYRSFMKAMIGAGKELVICTHAKNGATVLTKKGEWINVPIVESYNMMNANGAGDAFFSGFLYGYSQNYNILKCMQLGTISAGLCIESLEIANPVSNKALLEKEFEKHYK